MEVSELERMKELKQENRRLKQMFADLSLEHLALKEIIKKALTPAESKSLTMTWHYQRGKVTFLVFSLIMWKGCILSRGGCLFIWISWR